jgi:dihydroxyacetone kinase
LTIYLYIYFVGTQKWVTTGTILVHKVAGAVASVGLSLDEVAAEAKRASEMILISC